MFKVNREWETLVRTTGERTGWEHNKKKKNNNSS